MSWTSNGFFRNVSILKRFTAENGNTILNVYTPGTHNPASIKSGVRYSGFITALRAHVDITSIAEVEFPADEPGMSQGELNTALRAMDRSAAKKLLDIFLSNSEESRPTLIGSISLYNRRPYYTIDLLLYLTDAPAYDCASDCTLSFAIRSAGFGVLEGNDLVVINGSAIEEAENTAPSLNINVFVSGSSSSGGGSGGSSSGNVVTTTTGDVITTSTGDIITV